MKKKFVFLFLCSLLIGCINTPSTGSAKFIITDDLGRSLEFSEYPKRIVIAGIQTPMLANFFYLFPESSEKIIAIENRAQSPDQFLVKIDDEYQSKLILEKGAGVEQIAPVNPDLIILKTSMKDEIGAGIEEVGIPVIYVSFEDIEGIYKDIQIIGKVLNEEERAESIILSYQGFYNEIEKRHENTPDPNNVLLLQTTNIDQEYSFRVPSGGWLQTKMIEHLKSNPVWKMSALSGGWTEVNVEQIFEWNPDDIFIINYKGRANEIVRELKKTDLWKSFLSEHQTNLTAFPYDFISWDQPDPRWILGYSWIASKLYPDQIDPEYMVDLTKSFYANFYNLDESYIESEIIPSISVYLE